MTGLPYLDHTLSFDDRVSDLLGRMTIAEKAGQLTQYFYRGDALSEDEDVRSSDGQQEIVEEVKLVEREIVEGRAGSLLFVRDPKTTNRLQRLALERSRLGIPLLFGFDVIHGFRTIFPVPIALAATWRPLTAEQVQTIAAGEARAVGIHWAFAPMIDIARDPRWGRMVEGAGEDPNLGAAFAAAQVRGFQGDFGPNNILAGPKHLVGYGAARGGRDYEESDISESELYNVYLPPFHAAVLAGAKNIMSAYMELNGVPAAANRRLLTDVLRGDLGFQGFVVSDANAVRSLTTQHLAKSLQDAGVRALEAGLDMEMTIGTSAYAQLPAAVESGDLNEQLLNESVRRVLLTKFELGLFENAFVDESSATTSPLKPLHFDVARRAAEETIVLLKNNTSLLPLNLKAGQKVALVGELASSERDTLGPWVFAQSLQDTITVLRGLRSRLQPDVEVNFAPGVRIPNRAFPSIFENIDPAIQLPPDWDDDAEMDRAVELAAESDLAVVVVGQRQDQIGENASYSTMDLPGRQLEQLKGIYATGTPVVLLVMSGRPLDLRWAQDHIPAIAQIWYPGTRGGEAVASVLLGNVSPAARLPFTWPKHVGQIPTNYSHYRTFSPDDADKRYFNEANSPLYEFGHGLSYASFEYSNLGITRSEIRVGEHVEVTVDITNTSQVSADEVAQLYIHQRYGRSVRPIRELKGFERVFVPARSSRSLAFTLGPEELRYWSSAAERFVQEPSTIDIWVGGNSRATLSTELTVLL